MRSTAVPTKTPPAFFAKQKHVLFAQKTAVVSPRFAVFVSQSRQILSLTLPSPFLREAYCLTIQPLSFCQMTFDATKTLRLAALLVETPAVFSLFPSPALPFPFLHVCRILRFTILFALRERNGSYQMFRLTSLTPYDTIN